jgi:hypothetical protein
MDEAYKADADTERRVLEAMREAKIAFGARAAAAALLFAAAYYVWVVFDWLHPVLRTPIPHTPFTLESLAFVGALFAAHRYGWRLFGDLSAWLESTMTCLYELGSGTIHVRVSASVSEEEDWPDRIGG